MARDRLSSQWVRERRVGIVVWAMHHGWGRSFLGLHRCAWDMLSWSSLTLLMPQLMHAHRSCSHHGDSVTSARVAERGEGCVKIWSEKMACADMAQASSAADDAHARRLRLRPDLAGSTCEAARLCAGGRLHMLQLGMDVPWPISVILSQVGPVAVFPAHLSTRLLQSWILSVWTASILLQKLSM